MAFVKAEAPPRELPSSIPVERYPLSIHVDANIARESVSRKVDSLLSTDFFAGVDREEVKQGFSVHFAFAEKAFLLEEHNRKLRRPGANLHYHGRPHFFQTVYDTISITEALLRHNTEIAHHLTPHGVIAGVVSSAYHDIGYVYPPMQDKSAASRREFHVELSKKEAAKKILELDAFPSFDKEAIAMLVVIAIHGTHFPYVDTKREQAERFIQTLPLRQQKEAAIILKIVQLADLGGQTARKDQFNTGLRMLRREMNAEEPNMGTEIIGTNHEMNKKRAAFVKNVVIPTVGETAAEFFGSHDNPYERAWKVGMD